MKSARGIIIVVTLLLSFVGIAQTRSDGTAIVIVGATEYSIPIVCEDAHRPELGFSTEPSRITRAATGRSSGVDLRLRKWQETSDVIVSIDRYVAWMPMPQSVGGVLSVALDMSPISVMKNGLPALLTYDMWSSGERPPGITGVRFEANCSTRAADVPKSRRISD